VTHHDSSDGNLTNLTDGQRTGSYKLALAGSPGLAVR